MPRTVLPISLMPWMKIGRFAAGVFVEEKKTLYSQNERSQWKKKNQHEFCFTKISTWVLIPYRQCSQTTIKVFITVENDTKSTQTIMKYSIINFISISLHELMVRSFAYILSIKQVQKQRQHHQKSCREKHKKQTME